MFSEKLTDKIVRLISEDLILDERFKYELHLPSKGNGKHAVIEWSQQAGEWRALFTTGGGQSIYLSESAAVDFMQSFKELTGGKVLKVACSCDRCTHGNFRDLAERLKDVSHGACLDHQQDIRRLIQDLKEGAA